MQPEQRHVRFYQLRQSQMWKRGRQIPRTRLLLVDNVPDNVTEIGINLIVSLLQLISNFGNFAPQSLEKNRNYFQLLAHFYRLTRWVRCFRPTKRILHRGQANLAAESPPLDKDGIISNASERHAARPFERGLNFRLT